MMNSKIQIGHKKMINEHTKMLNNLGGFIKSMYLNMVLHLVIKGFTEIEQANKILKQTIIYEKNNIFEKVIYNSRNIEKLNQVKNIILD